jgi:hypothetical protein
MKLDGPIVDNLERAIASARRLRGHPVYKDTLTYWGELLQEARRIRLGSGVSDRDRLEALIVGLEVELTDRRA